MSAIFFIFSSPLERVGKFYLTLNLLTTTIVVLPSNASKWQIGFNSAFKGLSQLPAVTAMRVNLKIVEI